MNLRDKLNAISSKPAQPKAQERAAARTEAWHACHVHPAEEFPGWREVDSETIALMQDEPMPPRLDPRRILYLDTETTGFLGAGTVAFMIGAARMTDGGLEVHQYVLRDYPEEPSQLRALESMLAECDAICTFNGRSFDIPLLRTRFLMNRMRGDCLEKPQIDLLHIARRVYKLRLSGCSLGRMEEMVLGQPRVRDLPGAEAPQRFFAYLKTGEFHLLDEVLWHNEQDIASLCTLLAHMCRVYRRPEQLSFMEDVYQMGVSLERMRHPEEARRCYRLVSTGRLRAGSQLKLAQSYRRSGNRSGACDVWQEMIRRREGSAAPYIELAKHYEHIERDDRAALDMTRKAISLLAEPSLLDSAEDAQTRESLQRRYERLKRKIERKPGFSDDRSHERNG